MGYATGEAPDSSERQLHDECKTGGTQPANISMIYRRRNGPAPPGQENSDGPFEPASDESRLDPFSAPLAAEITAAVDGSLTLKVVQEFGAGQ
jgi:hypothetical protein